MSRPPQLVIDTTLLSRLRDVGLVDALPLAFGAVLVPAEVRRELGRRPGRVRQWLTRLLRTQGDFFRLCTEEDPAVRRLLEVDLDPGEAAVLAQAEATGATAVVDELRGHRRGRAMDLDMLRTGALLLRLKDAGALPAVAPVLTRLQALGFYLDAGAARHILEQAGET